LSKGSGERNGRKRLGLLVGKVQRRQTTGSVKQSRVLFGEVRGRKETNNGARVEAAGSSLSSWGQESWGSSGLIRPKGLMVWGGP